MSGIGKDKNSFNIQFSEVTLSRIFPLLFRELSEWRCRLIAFYDIAWSDNILETVTLCHLPAFFAFSPNDQDCCVSLSHLLHGCVTTYELSWRYLELKLSAQLQTSLLFSLAAAVRKEDVWAIYFQHLHSRTTV